MTSLALYYLLCYGITAIYIYSSIMAPVRKFVSSLKIKFIIDLTNCSMCLGFWVGLGVSLLIPNPPPFHFLKLALSSAGITWLLCSVTQAALWGKVFFETFYYVLKGEEDDS